MSKQESATGRSLDRHPRHSAPARVRPPGRVRSVAIDEAVAWLAGEGDLITAGMGGSVALTVQLGVLAHGSSERLTNLGRYCRRQSVRRAWGTDLARFAGELAHCSGGPEGLRRLQAEILIPLESDVLAGHRLLADRQELITCVCALVTQAGFSAARTEGKSRKWRWQGAGAARRD
jgi:hypothetical protein